MDLSFGQKIINRIGNLSVADGVVATGIGTGLSYLANSPSVVEAVTKWAAAAATGSVWKGMLVSMGLAAGAKFLANAKVQVPGLPAPQGPPAQ